MQRPMMQLLISVVVLLLSVYLGGCAVGPTVDGGPMPISRLYPESALFYLDQLVEGNAGGVSYLPLLSASQGMQRAAPIEPGKPVTLMVQGVRLPLRAPRRMDAVVVMDVRVAGSTSATEPIVIGHFPGALPGTRLPFQSLRVFGTDKWDPDFPFEFRVRVFDWREKRNERIAQALQQVDEVSSKLAGGTLNTFDPVVRTAIGAATDLIRRQQNLPIIDFKVGMYSADQYYASAGRLPLLRQGSWLIASKHVDTPVTYWMQDFGFADPGQAIFAVENGALLRSQPLDMPYLEVSVGQFATQPGRVRLLDDALGVVGVITDEQWERAPERVESASAVLWSSVSTEVAIRRFLDRGGREEFEQLIALLSARNTLQPTDRQRLLAFVRARTGETPLPSEASAIADWWNDYGMSGVVRDHNWYSPVQGWIDELERSSSPEDFEAKAEANVSRLLRALTVTTDSLVSSVSIDQPVDAGAGVSASDREAIVAFFGRTLRSDGRVISPFTSAAQVLEWWNRTGQYGALVYNGGRTLWLSASERAAERLWTPEVSLRDYHRAVCFAAGEVLPLRLRGIVDADADLGTAISAARPAEVATVISALQRCLPGYRVATQQEAREWWLGIGMDGKILEGQWVSPVLDWRQRFATSKSFEEAEVLERWIASGVLSQLDLDIIPRDGLHYRGGSENEGTFSSVVAWLELVNGARKLYQDREVLIPEDGLSQFDYTWVIARSNPPHAQALKRVFALQAALQRSSVQYVDRAAALQAIQNYLEGIVDGPLPTSEQLGEFFGGSAIKTGLGVKWKWTPAEEPNR